MANEQIWAPWRLCYIQGNKKQPVLSETSTSLLPGADPQCFLCQAVADPTDPARYVVHDDELSVSVLNRYPYNNGHLLVAPRRHVGRLGDLTQDEHTALALHVAWLVDLLDKVLHPDGYNIGLNLGRAAGAGLPGHLHWHIVPRWVGDTNFMPVLGSVNVIPQSLDALWNVLTAEIGRVRPAPDGSALT